PAMSSFSAVSDIATTPPSRRSRPVAVAPPWSSLVPSRRPWRADWPISMSQPIPPNRPERATPTLARGAGEQLQESGNCETEAGRSGWRSMPTPRAFGATLPAGGGSMPADACLGRRRSAPRRRRKLADARLDMLQGDRGDAEAHEARRPVGAVEEAVARLDDDAAAGRRRREVARIRAARPFQPQGGAAGRIGRAPFRQEGV